MTKMQAIINASASSTPRAIELVPTLATFAHPSALRTLPLAPEAFNLNCSKAVHEECLSKPFMVAWIILGAGLFLVLLQLGMFASVRLRSHIVDMKKRGITLIQKWLFVMMSATYPLVAKRCFSVLHCTACNSKEQCDTGSAMLVGGPTIARKAWDEVAGSFIKVYVKMPCWQGWHVPLGALAALVVCMFVIGYPAATYWRMRCSAEFRRPWPPSSA